MVQIIATTGDINNLDTDALVFNVFEGSPELEEETANVDRMLNGTISALIKDGEIRGKKGEITTVHTLDKLKAKKILVIGLGKREDCSVDIVRETAGNLSRHLRRIGVHRAATVPHGTNINALTSARSTQAITEGVIMGLYQFDQYLSKSPNEPIRNLDELQIVEKDQSKLIHIENAIKAGTILADSVSVARNLVNEPANIMHPSQMATVASEVATETNLELKVIGKDEMIKRKMGAILAVSAGSQQEPKLIVLTHHGDPSNPERNIALVGKGITFDSGGISIKPAGDMWQMKGDMSGGASVIGAMRAIALLNPKFNVFGIIPAVENMPSGTAQRPGDIIRAMNGKTIEVDNTDAEGRLVLADAICYAKEQLNVNQVVDIATLTGAMVVALGTITTGVMGTSQNLVDAVLSAAQSTGEKMWQLPMFDEYKEQNKSDWADVKNTGGRGAGSITAGFFISEFAEGVEWAHLDIAGTFLADKEKGHMVKGATGVPTRTLVRLVQNLAGEE